MAHHEMSSAPFTFSAEDHLTGIALWDVPARPQPTKLGTGEEFNVEIAVLCITKGCDLMGKTIQVADETLKVIATGKTTERAWNARYSKWQYRGRVKVKAPDEPGTFRWYGQFPRQSKHAGVRVPLTFSTGVGFPSPEETPLF